MEIPSSKVLTTNCLSRVFNSTVATYKYYWFISILEIYVGTETSRIKLWDIIISMIANAWYPVHYFVFRLGKMIRCMGQLNSSKCWPEYQ